MGVELLYSDFNQALNDVLLSGRWAGRPLYLVLDNAGREELSGILGIPPGEVEGATCRAVGRTFPPVGDPYWRHEKELLAWERTGRGAPPPFTALLFALSHAAERMESDGEFSHTNYYLRLAEVTGADRTRLGLHGRSTLQFWRAFSSWLSDTNYAFGRPTARQIGAQKYVSLAISQAIVRAEDRQCFHHLFEKYGFTGSDEVNPEEMAQYIASWVHGAAASKRLKAAWTKPELRPRISEVALAELQEWAARDDAAGKDGGNAHAPARLSLAASVLPGFPRRRLSLSLGRKWDSEAALSLRTGTGDKELTLDNVLYGAFATLSPATTLDLPRVLSQGISLAAPAGDHRHAWRPRLVIPFARSATGPFWTEAARASIGTEHMVLVLDSRKIREQVESILADVAMPGYTCATAAQVQGLPAGWVLYERVQLLRAVTDPPEHAVDLSPVGDAGGIRVEGGLSLAPGIWHRRAAPSIRLDGASPGGRLVVHEGVDETGPVVASAATSNGCALVDLGALALPAAGDLFVRGVAGKGREHATSLLVRTARRPQPLDRQGKGQVAWVSLDSAADSPVLENLPRVEGLWTTIAPRPLVEPRALDRHPPLGANGGELEVQAVDVADVAADARPARAVVVADAEAAAGMACGERGFHWYLVDTVPPGAPRSSPVAMECRDCGHAVLVRDRGSKKAAPASKRMLPPVPTPAPARETPRTSEVDLDLLLDALSFIGCGSGSSFEALVADAVESPWEATALAEGLSALGHLDLRRQPGSGRILSWCVPAPVVGMGPGDRGFLAGFRNEPLVEEARRRLIAAGGSLEAQELGGQPALLGVHGLPASEVADALVGLVDPHGRPVRVVDGVADRIAGACLGLGQAWSLLERATVGRAEGLEAFDLATNRWRESGGGAPGAYRMRTNGTAYIYRDDNGDAWRGPHAIVKLLAARRAGASLHAYDPGARQFESVLGCEPPGLLARALCACTGKLPTIAGGRTHYSDVTPAVASTILDLLYPGDATP